MENLTIFRVKLHDQAKNISFSHKEKISTIFNKIGSIAIELHYFSLIIIDSQNTLSYYSTMPAVEFNIFEKDLWIYDGIYNTQNHKEGSFFFWDELYSQDLKHTLELEKQGKFGFIHGFYIMKKVNDLFIIYSFATQAQKEREIFKKSREILVCIGDYFFSEMKEIYSKYVYRENSNHTSKSNKQTSHVRLIVDNKEDH